MDRWGRGLFFRPLAERRHGLLAGQIGEGATPLSRLRPYCLRQRARTVQLLWLILLLCPAVVMASRGGPVRFPGASAKSANGAVSVTVKQSGHFSIFRTGTGEKTGRGRLASIPGLLLVAASGDRLVLLDTWGERVTEEGNVLRILNGAGRLVSSHTLAQLFPPEVRAGFPRSMSGPRWRSDAWIDDRLGVFAVISGGLSTGYAPPMGVASVAVVGPELTTEGEAPLPAIVVLSLADGRRVEPWGALARRLAHPQRSAAARALVATPGAIEVPAGTLRVLYGDPNAALRSLAVELAVHIEEAEANEVLVAVLADCDAPAHQRTRAAAALLDRGDDRGAPLLLLATGSPRWKALAGRDRAGLCLRKLRDEAARAAAVPSLPELLGDAADARLVRLLKADRSRGRPTGTAALGLLLARGRSPSGWQRAAQDYVSCSRCPEALRVRAVDSLLEDAPEDAVFLLTTLIGESTNSVLDRWLFDRLEAQGAAAKPALPRLVEHPDPQRASKAMALLLKSEPDATALEAVSARFLATEARTQWSDLLYSLSTFHKGPFPSALVPTFVRVAREAERRAEASVAYQALGRGGEAGRAALQIFVREGLFASAAALAADPRDGVTIDACIEALERGGLEPEWRATLFGRIGQVIQSSGLPSSPPDAVPRMTKLLLAESDPHGRWLAATALGRAGEPGRKALGTVLLRYPDDSSEEVRQFVLALGASFGEDLPPELESKPGSGRPTSRPERWRAWAEQQSP